MTTTAQIRGAGPIFTTTAAVATDAVVSVHDSANSSDSDSTWYAEITSEGAQSIIDGFLLIVGTNFRLIDGTNIVDMPWTVSTLNQVGIVYDTTNMALNVNGFWSADVAYDGTMLQGILDLFRATSGFAGQIREYQRFDSATLSAGKSIIDNLITSADLTMTAGTGGGAEGYVTGSFGTLVPDDPFGFTINQFSEGPGTGDVILIVDGIQSQNIFSTIEIDGVTLTMLSATSFSTGAGVSTWTFDNTALVLVTTTVYPMIVKTA
jgi:hypothetical protein